MKHKLLFVIAALMLLPMVAQAQSRYEKEGNEVFASGLYKQAFDLYRKAAKQHPSPDLTYKMGDASRMANNYTQALGYYREIANSPSSVDFTDCFFYLALMYKNNGQVDSSAYWFDRYLSSFPSNPALESRARQESRACEWIHDSVSDRNQTIRYAVIHEGKNVNTDNSESGAVLVGDSLLLYSSIQELSAPGSRNAINFDLVLMQVYDAPVTTDGKPGPAGLNEWGFNNKELHTGNVAVDLRNNAIYFTRSISSGNDGTFQTIRNNIYVSYLKKGKWQKPKKVGGDVNSEAFSSTQPTIGYLADSSIILYYASNRPGGIGGFDIWYTIIPRQGGEPQPSVNLGTPINSPGDEITPFYENGTQKLYFSSDWHYGFGGFDVFSSNGIRDSWMEPINLGSSLNSPANDIYFNINPNSSNSGYLTSNRRGSYFISDNTCCNDIYRWKSKPYTPKKVETKPEPVMRKGEVHNLLPISLYFHNDAPDPKSELFTTKQTYFQTYNRYMFMRQQYKNAFSGMANEQARDSVWNEIDYFFDNEVQANCERFEAFINLLIDDLRAGHRVSLTVEGYASPVHTGNYNRKISQRRVATIVNQLMEYDHGKLKPFLGSKGMGSLQIREVAYGSTRADAQVSADRSNAAKSVFSVEASRERRIEILDYQYLEDDSTRISCLRIPSRAMHIGTFFVGETADIEVRIPHSAIKEGMLDFISVGSSDVKIIGYNKLAPGRDLIVYLRMDNRRADPTISSFLPLTIRVKGEHVTQTMFLEYSIVK